MDFRSEGEIDHFLNGFATGSLPRYCWTHAAHIAMAAARLYHEDETTVDNIRQDIRRYNSSQGVANTSKSGYHETLTMFWANEVRRHLAQTQATTRLDAVRGAIEALARNSSLPRRRYSFDVFTSVDARARWIPPDIG